MWTAYSPRRSMPLRYGTRRIDKSKFRIPWKQSSRPRVSRVSDHLSSAGSVPSLSRVSRWTVNTHHSRETKEVATEEIRIRVYGILRVRLSIDCREREAFWEVSRETAAASSLGGPEPSADSNPQPFCLRPRDGGNLMFDFPICVYSLYRIASSRSVRIARVAVCTA